MSTNAKKAFVAIHKETNELFMGSRGQVAFFTRRALKNSMNNRNNSPYINIDNGYNYKDDIWCFYEIDPIDKVLIEVQK